MVGDPGERGQERQRERREHQEQLEPRAMVERSHAGHVEEEEDEGIGAGRGVAGGEGEVRVVNDHVQVVDVVSSEAPVVRHVHLVAERVRAVERTEVWAADGEEMRPQTTHRQLADVRQDNREAGAENEPANVEERPQQPRRDRDALPPAQRDSLSRTLGSLLVESLVDVA